MKRTQEAQTVCFLLLAIVVGVLVGFARANDSSNPNGWEIIISDNSKYSGLRRAKVNGGWIFVYQDRMLFVPETLERK